MQIHIPFTKVLIMQMYMIMSITETIMMTLKKPVEMTNEQH